MTENLVEQESLSAFGVESAEAFEPPTEGWSIRRPAGHPSACVSCGQNVAQMPSWFIKADSGLYLWARVCEDCQNVHPAAGATHTDETTFFSSMDGLVQLPLYRHSDERGTMPFYPVGEVVYPNPDEVRDDIEVTLDD